MTKKKEIQKVTAVFFLITFITVLFIFTDDPPISKKANDSRIIFAVSEASQDIMIDIYALYGNFDNFNCHYKDMAGLCRDIDYNYGKEDGKEPIITHNVPNNSQTTCIYSPLNEEKGLFRKKSFWYCADCKGHAGYSSINPGTDGYCVDGKSAICPPVFATIP